ncbi:transglycosylase SLT domain-containing protein [Microbacterium esteraromaticum]|uniref:aggregation-promoting factor C-terminal-like domain-containing protein n=1 Tax=Microbacterium esteraromaticum TaxID=57043 RepID=UPI0028F716ED|nr:transglycosylase SLT domain-containing protein [Microbacterium esteraromaticum]
MTPENELMPTRPAQQRPKSGAPRRRRGKTLLAGLAVVGFSAAMIAPTGMAVADPQTQETTQTAFSLAATETQSIAVSADGAKIEPLVRSGFEVYVKPKPKPKPAPVAASSGGGGGGGSSAPPRYSGGGSKQDWMTAAGIAQSDWGYVDYIVSRESGWNPNATNPSSGACGLVQALPCSKVPGNGYNPIDNLRWGNGYATGRYGSWAAAYNFWTRNHWW